MKKITALLVSLLLILCMGTTAFAQDVTISTTVPEWHTVFIEVEGGGKVVADHQICGDSIRIARQWEQTYWIIPDAGEVLSALYYNGENVTSQVRAGVFTAPALTDDAALRAVFTDAEVPSGDTGYDVGGTITGPDGKPISDATVDIGGHTGTTDGNGNFIVEDVPPGTHTVTVTDKDGNVIGIGEITIEEPDGNSLIWTTDGNGNPVIIPGRNITAISLTMTVGEDGVISIGNVKDVTPARAEQEQPEDTGKPGAAGGGSSQTGSKTAANSSGSAASSGSPATGDETNLILWFFLLTLSLCGFVGIWIFQKKKQSKL